MNKKTREEPGMNGVIITTYVESPTIRSHKKNDPLKRIYPKPFSKRPQTARTRGYDRRAQLLAYARELRDADTQQLLAWPKNNSRPKPKKWRLLASPARDWVPFNRIFQRVKRRWRYKRITSQEETEVSGLCCPRSGSKGRKRKDIKRSISYFCRRLRSMLKELSCHGQCNKG